MRSTNRNSVPRVRQLCFYLTRRCNLLCTYCKVPRIEKKELSTQEVLSALDIMAKEVKPEFLVLFGGEPFVRKDIGKIVDRVNELGFKYTLITNGTIDNEKVIGKLKGLTLSIDRPYQEKFGGMENVKSNWDMLKKYKDVVPDLVANITVTSTNIRDLGMIVDQLNDLDVWVIFGLVHSTGKPNDEAMFRSWCPELLLSKQECFTFDRVLRKAKKRHNSLMYGKLASRYGPRLSWHCANNPRNPEYMTVDSDGKFIACNDWWGKEVSKYGIFDLPEIGLKKWWKACRADRNKCKLRCYYNHELNLMYPHKSSLLHGE